MGRLGNFLFAKEGGKRRLKASAVWIFCGLPLALIALYLIFGREKEEPTSTVAVSSRPLIGEDAAEAGQKTAAPSPAPKGVGTKKEAPAAKRPRRREAPKPTVRFSAVQVIERNAGRNRDGGNSLPVGTTGVGKLLTPVDTRARGAEVRAVLPYGLGRKGKIPAIPRGSVLLGGFSRGGGQGLPRLREGRLPRRKGGGDQRPRPRPQGLRHGPHGGTPRQFGAENRLHFSPYHDGGNGGSVGRKTGPRRRIRRSERQEHPQGRDPYGALPGGRGRSPEAHGTHGEGGGGGIHNTSGGHGLYRVAHPKFHKTTGKLNY